ncbi:MAG: hypothetical protein ABSG43_11915 [Solirubrobacteraceae bacterium]
MSQATGRGVGSVGEVLPGLWRFEAQHPEWTEDDGGADGWEQTVGWWAVALAPGLALIDPLVIDWPALDQLVSAHGGCAGVIRTCQWHQRSVAEVATRYRAGVWAKRHPDAAVRVPLHHAVGSRDELFEAVRAIDVERGDELALWLPAQRALVFGDAMLRTGAGELRACPQSWLQPEGGRARLLALLGGLAQLPVEHVLVSHGPLVLGDGLASLRAATA